MSNRVTAGKAVPKLTLCCFILLLASCSSARIKPIAYTDGKTSVVAQPQKIEWTKIILPTLVMYLIVFKTI